MRSYSCYMIENMELHFSARIDGEMKAPTLCCGETFPDRPGIFFKESAEESLADFLSVHAQTVAEGIQRANGETPAGGWQYTTACARCVNYRCGEHQPERRIRMIDLAMFPAPCQCRCNYCTVSKKWKWENTPEVRAAYEKVFSFLETAEEHGLIHPDAIWHVATGEITIHPYRERIMKLVEGRITRFCTNAFLFDERIAHHLHEQSSSDIFLSIDAGTPETWRKVKGFDNFDDVLANLGRYHDQTTRPGQIALKYIVMPGINDTEADYEGVIQIMKRFDVPSLSVSRDAHIKYTMTDIERAKLLKETSRLLFLLKRNGLEHIFIHYSQEEQDEILRLTEEQIKAADLEQCRIDLEQCRSALEECRMEKASLSARPIDGRTGIEEEIVCGRVGLRYLLRLFKLYLRQKMGKSSVPS